MFVFRRSALHDWHGRACRGPPFAFTSMVVAHLSAYAAVPSGGHLTRASSRQPCAATHRFPPQRLHGYADGGALGHRSCVAGMPGTQTDSSLALLTSTSSPASPRWPRGPWRRSWPSSLWPAFAFLRRTGRFCVLVRSGAPGALLYLAMVLALVTLPVTAPEPYLLPRVLLATPIWKAIRHPIAMRHLAAILGTDLVVVLLALIAVDGHRGSGALIDGIHTLGVSAAVRRSSLCKPCAGQRRRCLPEFLFSWAAGSIVFISCSQCKRPG